MCFLKKTWRAYWMQGRMPSMLGSCSEQNTAPSVSGEGQWYYSNRETTNHPASRCTVKCWVFTRWGLPGRGEDRFRGRAGCWVTKGRGVLVEERERPGQRRERVERRLQSVWAGWQMWSPEVWSVFGGRVYCFELVTHFLNHLCNHHIPQIVITASIPPSTPLRPAGQHHLWPSQVCAPDTSTPKSWLQDRTLLQ